MKRFLTVMLLGLSLCCAFAQEESALSLSLDLRALDALFLPTLQTDSEVKMRINDEFSLRIPLFVTSDLMYNDVQLWEFGLMLDYHPFQSGLYLSVSLIQMGIFSGYDKPEESILYLNEVAFGYIWHISKGLYLEPRIVIRDPSGVFEAEYALVEHAFPGRSKFRISLLFGWEFLAIPPL